MASFNKYSGIWNANLAAHLLRRSTFGVALDTIQDFGKKTLDECMDIIFQKLPTPDPPINYIYTKDPDTPIGETWTNKAPNSTFNSYRNQSLVVWSFDLMMSGQPNIREKMTIFWHNHFVTSFIRDAGYNYKYMSLLRAYALGNFRDLAKAITIDPAMLEYLNGKDSTKKAPNENFGRELLELFTIGKGDLAGPGDYTNYTEEDVKQMARGFTGWINVRNAVPAQSKFEITRHDTGTKTLSHRFDYAVVNNEGENEYKVLIDIIFQKEAVSEFIATKLYRWFVHYEINDDIKQNIIKPMAEMIRNSDYEVAPAIRALLSSEHFYESCVIGRMIKNPMDFIFNAMNQFQVALPTENLPKVRLNTTLYGLTQQMQMAILNILSVGGWPPFYQEPSYNRLWLNAVGLTNRKIFTEAIVITGYKAANYKTIINQLEMLSRFDNPADVASILNQYMLLLFPNPLKPNQVNVLEGILNSGSEGDWAKVYADYLINPGNQRLVEVLNARLKNLTLYMMQMPEYHLS